MPNNNMAVIFFKQPKITKNYRIEYFFYPKMPLKKGGKPNILLNLKL